MENLTLRLILFASSALVTLAVVADFVGAAVPWLTILIVASVVFGILLVWPSKGLPPLVVRVPFIASMVVIPVAAFMLFLPVAGDVWRALSINVDFLEPGNVCSNAGGGTKLDANTGELLRCGQEEISERDEQISEYAQELASDSDGLTDKDQKHVRDYARSLADCDGDEVCARKQVEE